LVIRTPERPHRRGRPDRRPRRRCSRRRMGRRTRQRRDVGPTYPRHPPGHRGASRSPCAVGRTPVTQSNDMRALLRPTYSSTPRHCDNSRRWLSTPPTNSTTWLPRPPASIRLAPAEIGGAEVVLADQLQHASGPRPLVWPTGRCRRSPCRGDCSTCNELSELPHGLSSSWGRPGWASPCGKYRPWRWLPIPTFVPVWQPGHVKNCPADVAELWP
jgi:hypothetical protein